MNTEQKNILLKTAKVTITSAVKGEPIKTPESEDKDLNVQQGCFVTIKNHHKLRGCIGQFTSDVPLIQLVSQMAVSSSTSDPRFYNDPITPNELDNLDIKISVLSPLKLTDDPLSLRLGVDGIYIQKGYQSGCFLPQVATETGWTKEEFLSNCCAGKAALSPDSWKDPDTEVFLFTCDVFGDKFNNIK